MPPGRRSYDLEWESRIRDAERVANESRAEFRKISQDLKDEFKEFRKEITASVHSLKDAISEHKIKTLTNDKSERKEYRIERWKFIGVVLGILVYGAAVPMMLNWERVEVMWQSIETHFKRAGQTKVPLMLDVTKRPRRHHRKKLPPIVMPPEPKHEEKEKPETESPAPE